MYNQPFFIPGYYRAALPNMFRGSIGRMMMPSSAIKGGIFSKLSSTFAAIKKFNWSGLINNTSKTLGIINQGIPLVKQVGPVMNNMRSIMKIASVFKDEIDNNSKISVNKNLNMHNTTFNDNYKNSEDHFSKSINYDNSPTFFIN